MHFRRIQDNQIFEDESDLNLKQSDRWDDEDTPSARKVIAIAPWIKFMTVSQIEKQQCVR
jgi:hypothetical protein